jgi:hypothetical protein
MFAEVGCGGFAIAKMRPVWHDTGGEWFPHRLAYAPSVVV